MFFKYLIILGFPSEGSPPRDILQSLEVNTDAIVVRCRYEVFYYPCTDFLIERLIDRYMDRLMDR